MPLMPTNALSRKLAWNDFTKVEADPPEEGETAQAAWTDVGYKYEAASVQSTEESNHKKYKLVTVPTITMEFNPNSWVASFVFDWDDKHQKDLLKHEQLHYMISMLAGRDCAAVFEGLKDKEYDDTATPTTEFNAAYADLNVQKIQKKYDKDTHSLPTDFPTEQSSWAKAISDAHTNDKPLRATLMAAGLITKDM